MATTHKPTIMNTPIPAAGAAAAAAGGAAGKGTPGKKSGGGKLWILIGIGVLVLIGLAIGGWLWRKHAHAHAHGKTVTVAAAPKVVKTAGPAETVSMQMDPFVVNLADPGGHSYARIAMTLRLTAPPSAPKAADDKPEGSADGDELKAIARDTILTVLSQQQSVDLLAAGGKDHLKDLLRQAMIARDPRLKVVDIYFTEFLVQA